MLWTPRIHIFFLVCVRARMLYAWNARCGGVCPKKNFIHSKVMSEKEICDECGENVKLIHSRMCGARRYSRCILRIFEIHCLLGTCGIFSQIHWTIFVLWKKYIGFRWWWKMYVEWPFYAIHRGKSWWKWCALGYHFSAAPNKGFPTKHTYILSKWVYILCIHIYTIHIQYMSVSASLSSLIWVHCIIHKAYTLLLYACIQID